MTSVPATVTVRLAARGDAAAIAGLHAASWRIHYRGSMSDHYLDGPIEADRRRIWADRLSAPDPRQVIWLAEDAGDLLGFACTFVDHDPDWGTLIDNLHVRDARRGGGLGRRLIGRTARTLASLCPDRPVHLYVLEANTAAQAFYDRIGGEAVGHDHHVLPDGSDRPVIRYAWASPASLLKAERG